MAQTTQIVPMWTFPHVQSYVSDYTQLATDDTVVSTFDYPNFLSVFISNDGIDNTIVRHTTVKGLTDVFGKRDFANNGQPYAQAIDTLTTANGRVYMYCMRVMPEDATFANSYATCYYKADVANKKFNIFWTFHSLTDDDAPKTVAEFSEHMQDTPAEMTGYTGITLIGARTTGRGKYGNNFRWRMTRDKDWEKEYKIKVNKYQILKAENGLSSVYTGSGSNMYTLKTGVTTYINDLFADNNTNGQLPAMIEINEAGLNALYDAYVEFLKAVQTADPTLTVVIPDEDCFDPFFGLNVNSTLPVEYINILTNALTAEEQQAMLDADPSFVYNADDYAPDGVTVAIFDDIQGNFLTGGSDGAFASADKEARQKAIDTCYINAFDGLYDKKILSAHRIPASALFDANYSFDVKVHLAALAETRNDALCYLDCGIMSSFSDMAIRNLVADYAQFDRLSVMDGETNIPCISKNLHHYTIRDPETGRKNVVTFTYFLSTMFYNHYMTYGLHVPMANVRAILSGHVRDSLEPTVETFENELRQTFTDNRFNWCEATAPNEFRRICQLVAQIPESDLIEESNVHTLFELKRNIERDCRDVLYDFTDASSRQLFSEYIKARYTNWENRKVQSLSVSFTQNEWEGERSIIHGYINVVFRGLQKRIILEFDVNRRDYTTTTTTE